MKKQIIISLMISIMLFLCGCSVKQQETTTHSTEFYEETLSYDSYGNISQRIIVNKQTNCSYIYTYYYIYDNGFFILNKTEVSTIDGNGDITITQEEKVN